MLISVAAPTNYSAIVADASTWSSGSACTSVRRSASRVTAGHRYGPFARGTLFLSLFAVERQFVLRIPLSKVFVTLSWLATSASCPAQSLTSSRLMHGAR